MSEIESVLLEREVDALVGMALAYAADGQLDLATGIAEKVERLAPWSPRYLQLQVYLDEEGARRRADALVGGAREHLEAGRGRRPARRRRGARDHARPRAAPQLSRSSARDSQPPPLRSRRIPPRRRRRHPRRLRPLHPPPAAPVKHPPTPCRSARPAVARRGPAGPRGRGARPTARRRNPRRHHRPTRESPRPWRSAPRPCGTS